MVTPLNEGVIRMAPRKRASAAVVEDDVFEDVDEIEELDDPDDALEELEEEPAPAPTKRAAKKAPAKAAAAPAKATPAKRTTKAAAAPAAEPSSEYDSNWLAEYITEETGVNHDGRAVRMLLRRLAKDGAFDREIGTDRSRYTFPKGAGDPVVRQVLRMVKSGEATAVRREGLETARASKAAKSTAPAKKTAPSKAAPAKKTTARRRTSAE